MTASTIQLEILNWKKFNARDDVKKPSWFRCENTLIDSPDFYDFEHSEILFWVYILSMASRKKSETVLINLSHASKACRFQKETIKSSIEKLVQLQCVRVCNEDAEESGRIRSESERERVESGLYTTLHNTTLHNITLQDETLPRIESRTQSGRKAPATRKPSADSATAEIGKQASQIIARYCELWKLKYKTQPAFSSKWAGNAKTLVKDHGLPKAITLIESFMKMEDVYFTQRRHSFEIILTSLAQIAHYAGTGIQMQKLNQPFNRAEARTNANRDAMEKYLGTLEEEAL